MPQSDSGAEDSDVEEGEKEALFVSGRISLHSRGMSAVDVIPRAESNEAGSPCAISLDHSLTLDLRFGYLFRAGPY